MKKTLLFLMVIFAFSGAQQIRAQTADEIIGNYLEAIGGEGNLKALQSVKMICKGRAQGTEIPITMYQKAPGKQRMDMVFQGQEMTQMSFNGEEGWSTNFMTMQAEKWDAEQSGIMKAQMDFPDAFLDYKGKGYAVSLEGEEEVEGTACYKVRLTRQPITIDGKEEENFAYYFFDKDTYVPIMQQQFAKTGELKGQTTETYLSDFDEVGGVYFPHTIAQKLNGQSMFDLTIEKIEVNVEMDDNLFDFPEAKKGE